MDREEALEIIDFVEDKNVQVNPDWFYHGSPFDIDSYKSIMRKGILCAKARGDVNIRFNGEYYVCLSKNISSRFSAYDIFLKRGPMFIVRDAIHVFRANKQGVLANFCINTPFPIRMGGYDDEYQVFWKVKPREIVGIELLIKSYVERAYDKSFVSALKMLKTLVKLVNDIDSSIPVYDFTDNKEINKDKVLGLKL